MVTWRPHCLFFHPRTLATLQVVSSHKVVLFMKGTPQAPQCGFSKRVVDILKSYSEWWRARRCLQLLACCADMRPHH